MQQDDAVQALRERVAAEFRVDEAAARTFFPGPVYTDVLKWLHAHGAPDFYLEIGVKSGGSLSQAGPATRCLAIDPAPRLPEDLARRVILFPGTSDAFFERYDLGELLNGRTVDLAFIDGLHTYDQVLRDFINVERCCDPQSLIVLHDVAPLDARVASRERATRFWAGDVWKAVPILERLRPDLTLTYVPCFPTGLLLVTDLDPSSTVLEARFETAVSDLQGAVFEGPADRVVGHLPACANAEDAVRRFVGEHWRRAG